MTQQIHYLTSEGEAKLRAELAEFLIVELERAGAVRRERGSLLPMAAAAG